MQHGSVFLYCYDSFSLCYHLLGVVAADDVQLLLLVHVLLRLLRIRRRITDFGVADMVPDTVFNSLQVTDENSVVLPVTVTNPVYQPICTTVCLHCRRLHSRRQRTDCVAAT